MESVEEWSTPDLSGQITVPDAKPTFVGPYSMVYIGLLGSERVAVKVVRKIDGIEDHKMERKIRREWITWGRLKHPNVLPLYGFANDHDLFQPCGALISPWRARGDATKFLTEYGEGLSKEQKLKLRVEYLHNHRPVVIHGDLKTRNILIDDSGIPQICDFGLVSLYLEERSSGLTTTSAHTGTDRYLAPELLVDEDLVKPTAASDIWALGCIGLEIYFSQQPHARRKNNMRGLIFKDIKGGKCPGTKPELYGHQNMRMWALLNQYWHLEPSKRPSARMALASLEGIVSSDTYRPLDGREKEGYAISGENSMKGSGPYSTLRFPKAPLFPPIPIPTATYPNAAVSPVDFMDDFISSHSGPAAEKPPHSSALPLNGLPIYSASGFDILDILARVATRQKPKILLGPVDLSCSFLIVDITRDDLPIIYASQTFGELTGYSEQEVLGRNARFLQASPGVPLEKGSPREHTDIDSVTQMVQNVSLNRECQVTLVNYRKTGEAFINCLTIIPVLPSGNEPVKYHIGLLVDLAVRPLAIMRSVQSGYYVTNYSFTPLPPSVTWQEVNVVKQYPSTRIANPLELAPAVVAPPWVHESVLPPKSALSRGMHPPFIPQYLPETVPPLEVTSLAIDEPSSPTSPGLQFLSPPRSLTSPSSSVGTVFPPSSTAARYHILSYHPTVAIHSGDASVSLFISQLSSPPANIGHAAVSLPKRQPLKTEKTTGSFPRKTRVRKKLPSSSATGRYIGPASVPFIMSQLKNRSNDRTPASQKPSVKDVPAAHSAGPTTTLMTSMTDTPAPGSPLSSDTSTSSQERAVTHADEGSESTAHVVTPAPADDTAVETKKTTKPAPLTKSFASMLRSPTPSGRPAPPSHPSGI